MTEEQTIQQSVQVEGQQQTQTSVNAEENNHLQEPQNNVDNNNTLDATGASTTNENVSEGTNTQEGNKTLNTEATDDVKAKQLESKLAEYELKEQEIANLRQRLGFQEDVPSEIVQLGSIEATFENQALTEWNRLCNQYGVDSTQSGFEQSIKTLAEKDPKAYYEFESKAERLSNAVEQKRTEIVSQRNMFEVRKALTPHKDLIQNSPIINSIVSDYIATNLPRMSNPTQEMNLLIDAVKSIYLEAFEMGKNVAKYETVKNDTSGANTSIAGSTSGGYNIQGEHIFTRAEIANMNSSDFEKNLATIERQQRLGLIK